MKKIDQSLQVIPGDSKICRNFIYGVHFLTFVVVLVSLMPWIVKMGGGLLVAMSLRYNLIRMMKEAGIYTLHYCDAFGWELKTGNGRYQHLQILGSSVSTSFFVLLHVQQRNNIKKAILIPRDSVHKEDYRKMMRILKLTA